MRPQVITLGTAGGPRWWKYGQQPVRNGISTALEIAGKIYLIDCGYGTSRALIQAGYDLSDVEAVFITHLHSDHLVDLTSLLLFSTFEITEDREPIDVIGPGTRGVLPLVSPNAKEVPEPVNPQNPVPDGITATLQGIVHAHAADLNERVFDSLRPSPLERFRGQDIELPVSLNFHANENPTPTMEPFTVYEDARVRVSATLVQHPPMAPAFGFRFDTDNGSLTISGDTASCENMVALANGTDLLLHEAIDLKWLMSKYADPESPTAKAIQSHHLRSHTPIESAIDIAREARVKRLGLHHLVPGTSGPSLRDQLKQFTDLPVVVPDDMHRFTLGR